MSVPIYLDEIKEEEAKVTGEGDNAEDQARREEGRAEAHQRHPAALRPRAAGLHGRRLQAVLPQGVPRIEDPLFWIHLNVDYPFKLKGILYFPKIKEQFGGIEGQIKLYSGQVFVADNIKEVIPEFLMLLKGVIDCADFPLNVSRSFLQNDGYVRRISNHITKKVADRLTGMFKTERATYEGFWPDIHPFIKYGVMRDEKFAERMKDCLLFKTTDGKFLTLAEYKERNGEKLPDKMVYTSDPGASGRGHPPVHRARHRRHGARSADRRELRLLHGIQRRSGEQVPLLPRGRRTGQPDQHRRCADARRRKTD